MQCQMGPQVLCFCSLDGTPDPIIKRIKSTFQIRMYKLTLKRIIKVQMILEQHFCQKDVVYVELPAAYVVLVALWL
jgi:hypothetical protein